jgi:molybdopterin-containing oxidoreductase family iron-sulfur binding subunit
LDFASQLLKVGLRVHLGLENNETAQLCHWHIPETHYLEAWGDARAYDGTVSIVQPLIAPLYNGRSAHEIFAVMLGQAGRTPHDVVQDFWRGKYSVGDFETFWRTSLHDGLIANSALPARPVTLKADFSAPAFHEGKNGSAAGALEISFRPDPGVWDGRFANNGWLQELPKPLTKLTWDNAVLLSVSTAQKLGLHSEDVVRLRYRGRELAAPVFILPGHADDAVTLHLGYGRSRAGRVGSGVGANANALRTSENPWFAGGLEISKTGETYRLARTQHHSIVRSLRKLS